MGFRPALPPPSPSPPAPKRPMQTRGVSIALAVVVAVGWVGAIITFALIQVVVWMLGSTETVVDEVVTATLIAAAVLAVAYGIYCLPRLLDAVRSKRP